MTSETPKHRLAVWFATERVGMSSKFLAKFYLGVYEIESYPDHPHDRGDFMRCVKLVDAVPEIRERFPEIREVSEDWKYIVDRWDRLIEQCEKGKCFSILTRSNKTHLKQKIRRRLGRCIYCSAKFTGRTYLCATCLDVCHAKHKEIMRGL